jgi:hypothetical protein
MASPVADQQVRITHAMNAVADAVRVVEAFETKHIVQPTLDDIGDMLRAAELVEATNRIGDRYGHDDYESAFDVIHRAVADGDPDALFLIREHKHVGAAA